LGTMVDMEPKFSAKMPYRRRPVGLRTRHSERESRLRQVPARLQGPYKCPVCMPFSLGVAARGFILVGPQDEIPDGTII
jgi:hypothetical protein